MNPSLKLLLVLLISLEISFTNRLLANLIIISIVVIILLRCHLRGRQWLGILLIPLLPALSLFVTIVFYSPSHSVYFGFVLISRIYLYISLGASITFTTSPLVLARSLEQNVHLPAKFAYGILAATNLLPKIRQEIRQIRIAAQMRGQTLHLWSPTIYFKAIFIAIRWSTQLAQAIEAHGFVEGQSRTATQIIPLTRRDWGIFICSIVTLQLVLIILP